MKPSLPRVAAALAVPLLLLAGCSSGSSGSSGGSSSDSAAQKSASGSRQLGETASGAAGAPASVPQAADVASQTGAAPVVEQASIISTGSVSLTAPDVAQARIAVEHVADTYAGQVTDQETATADDKKMGFARLVLRVPSRSFDDAMGDLEKAATLVDSKTTSTDVSTQVIDVDERVKSARASIDRITTLLSRAEKIGDIMAIESQLSAREADLNSLLRQQAHLADQTSLSTISVSIDRPAAVHHTRTVPGRTGFMAGLEGGWDALRAFATGVGTVVGALLPWTPVIAVIGVPVWLLVRRARRTRPPAASPDAV
ncbi:DUF4349 domain-containing protein [Nocardioides sp. CER19]|uniref:DUF4349 domain-containing protein n=1 Tax=Nocardioides sp. CER19 TaxID=3038538 RepID=UPI00244870F1|nr:DUF4349 domain-containing protein [Nocardioides sp. CER19]MDH2414770.1 DUF4349 domain-containing protein [Nocardioides sp. CER19]